MCQNLVTIDRVTLEIRLKKKERKKERKKEEKHQHHYRMTGAQRP